MVKSKRVMFEFTVKSSTETDVREWQHAQQLLPQASSVATEQAIDSGAPAQEALDLNAAPQSPPLSGGVATSKPIVQKSPTPSPSPSPPQDLGVKRRSLAPLQPRKHLKPIHSRLLRARQPAVVIQ